MLVVLLSKQIMAQRLVNFKSITDHNHNKYITAPDFDTLAASFF